MFLQVSLAVVHFLDRLIYVPRHVSVEMRTDLSYVVVSSLWPFIAQLINQLHAGKWFWKSNVELIKKLLAIY
jgi:hypothetical protein